MRATGGHPRRLGAAALVLDHGAGADSAHYDDKGQAWVAAVRRAIRRLGRAGLVETTRYS
jgi:hypothetical protein